MSTTDGGSTGPPDHPSRPPPNRRRDKPQLSCNLCRRRKLRCDRQHPCSNCKRRELGPSCTYASGLPTIAPPSSAIHDRLRHLEDLVVSYIGTDAASSQPAPPGHDIPDEPPVSSGFGILKRSSTETKYQDPTHWSSILDAISELKDDVGENADLRLSPSLIAPLLYGGGKPTSREDIIAALPPQNVINALVLDYFDVLNLTSCALHKDEFLKQLSILFESPDRIPIMWLGLLFGVLSASTYFQDLSSPPNALDRGQWNLDYDSMGLLYREKTVQCLTLGRYTRCGPYVIETLLHYLASEFIRRRETSNEMWLLTTTTVHLAMRMGYHRDPEHYRNLSPYEGEMRRRVWAMLYHLDLSMSSQLGVPRITNESFADTALPRNLLDSDFNSSSTELPESRSDDDPTPMMVINAKIRLGRIHTLVIDAVTKVTPPSYGQILQIDRQMEEKFAEIPMYCKVQWQPPASTTDPPTMALQRLMVNMSYHKAQITLHWRYLALAKQEPRYMYSRKVAVSAAFEILELNRTVYERLKTGNRLISMRWRVNNVLNNDFFLATSVLCFYLHLYQEVISTEEINTTMQSIRATKRMWDLRTSDFPEAHRAATAIRSVFPGIFEFGPDMDSEQNWLSTSTDTVGSLPAMNDQDPFLDASMPFFDSLFEGASMSLPRATDPESLIGSFLTGNVDPWLQASYNNPNFWDGPPGFQ